MRRQQGPAGFGFDRYDKERLRKALQRVSDKATFIGLKAVLLIAQGMAVQAVADLFDKSVQIVYHWVRTYVKTHEPGTLYNAPKSGRPFAAQQITDERILAALRQTPLHLGYPGTAWTVSLLAAHLSHLHGCEVGYWTL